MSGRKSLRIGKESFVNIMEGDITQFYEVQKKIGEGAYGRIYKVRDKQSGDIRAMKQVTKAKIQDMGKFQDEIKILSLVDHPNIVRLFEVIEDDKYYNLIQELCTGGELLTRAQKSQLKEKISQEFFIKLCQGLLISMELE